MTERKKILWLCSWYPGLAEPFNGDFVQRHARAAALFHDIHVIHVYADPNGRLVEPRNSILRQNGLTEHIIEFPKRNNRIGRAISHFRLLRAYNKAVRSFIKEQGLPDLVHVHVPVWAGKIALWVKRKYGIPFLVTEHWAIYNDQAENNYLHKSFRFKYYSKKIFREAALFLPVCHYLAKGVSKLVRPVHYEVIENTVDTTLFQPARQDPDLFQFIHISNMEPRKNVRGIIAAFSRLMADKKNVKLLIVGPAPDELIEFARHQHPAIEFTGEISYPAVANCLRKANALVMFSNNENSPCVIGEALCCGLPVITTDAGGISELVDPSNAIIVKTGEEKMLAQAMCSMLEDRKKFDQQLIASRASARFSFSTIGKKISDQYEKLLGH